MRGLFRLLRTEIHGMYQKQWHPQVAYLLQDSMQRSLIDHRTLQKRRAILFERDRQPIEPAHPVTTQMSLQPDLIDRRFVRLTP